MFFYKFFHYKKKKKYFIAKKFLTELAKKFWPICFQRILLSNLFLSGKTFSVTTGNVSFLPLLQKSSSHPFQLLKLPFT